MFKENVEFLSLYYAKADRDDERLAEIFDKVFSRAHPSWTIEKVLVEPPSHFKKTAPVTTRFMTTPRTAR